MIIGIGSDLIDITRVAKVIERHGERFLDRIFTPAERAKAEAAANRIIKDFGNGVQVLNGRYGPYITDGEKNARIPKGRDRKRHSRERRFQRR